MRLEDQICTYEQAKKLHELGVRDESSIVQWHTDNDFGTLAFFRVQTNLKNQYSAFTVAELGLMLPDLIESDNRQYEFVCIKESDDEWLCRYVRNNNMVHCLNCMAAGITEASARATILISLLEEGIVKADEINNRLKSNQ